VLSEIGRLKATDAFILGGTGAVSAAVEAALESELGTGHVTRLGGANRYETANLIAGAVAAAPDSQFDGTAFIATGLNFPDALAGSPLAAAGDWPILLSPASGLTASTLASIDSIGVSEVLILGGTGVVSEAIESELNAKLGGNVTRLAGPTRYHTANTVAGYGVSSAGLKWDCLALATGQNFPDALAGGVLQGLEGSVMLLTQGTQLHDVVGDTLNANRAVIGEVRFLGGTGAVAQSVRDEALSLIE
jgi:putative cell wall-binding protein